MQRLFSTFPSGRIGIALLLLRLVVAGGLLFVVHRNGSLLFFYICLIPLVAIATFCLLAGLMTPIFAALCALLDAIEFGSLTSLPLLFVVATAIVLALVGPGAYSVDAVLFGRRLIRYTRQKT